LSGYNNPELYVNGIQ